ncbi:hypothetical protein [Ochrobactrum sp. Marseille-Q0166]|uniref:hypothetical protein n=1 Tax=Ochrobactrum sp. Marseille-Q0166 TaxID=2761105 RepID=UPI0016561F87|nr:hypothetical protein [Ochrobactrum sp. Marseille-Q0166]MBC8716947.1 hypothetical protein [Ochrobactrum sp. Marseille-Q0166]
MNAPYFEIVTYKVNDITSADKERARAREQISALPGFIAWMPFTGTTDADDRVDLVSWLTLDDAQAAAKLVGTAPEFAAFRATLKQMVSIGHYKAMTPPQMASSGNGLELGHFRLKSGADEQAMRDAYTAMVSNHLSLQAGWQAQHLVKLADGTFVDLAFADNQTTASEICANWHGNADCDAFLSLIEPVSMEFGTIL